MPPFSIDRMRRPGKRQKTPWQMSAAKVSEMVRSAKATSGNDEWRNASNWAGPDSQTLPYWLVPLSPAWKATGTSASSSRAHTGS